MNDAFIKGMTDGMDMIAQIAGFLVPFVFVGGIIFTIWTMIILCKPEKKKRYPRVM